MSEHEPECYALTHRDSGDDRCICKALRQAEQRVRQDLSSTTAVNPRDGADWKEGGPASEEHGALSRKERQYRFLADTNHEYDDGYTAGVKAAREAVVAYHKGSCRRYYYENRCTCGLDAAIDALEKR